MRRNGSTPRWICFALVVAAALWAPPAGAWSRQGHMVTGAVAYARLQEIDPAALAVVLDLLRQHPHHDDLLAARDEWRVAAEDADIALFMNAARWADDVRSEPWDDYDRPHWHYVNFHYENGQLRPPDSPERDGFLLRALAEQRERLGTGSATARAVALTWIFHLVGDIHQPLHTIAYHAPEHPRGDRGGNDFYVRASARDETVRLHWLWDGLVLGTDRFREVRNRATALRNRPGLRPGDLADEAGVLEFERWAHEGAELAVEQVYRRGALRSGTDRQGTILPDDYLSTVQPLAERRAVLAGYRLAAVLAEAY